MGWGTEETDDMTRTSQMSYTQDGDALPPSAQRSRAKLLLRLVTLFHHSGATLAVNITYDDSQEMAWICQVSGI